jgi:hypothetical protein
MWAAAEVAPTCGPLSPPAFRLGPAARFNMAFSLQLIPEDDFIVLKRAENRSGDRREQMADQKKHDGEVKNQGDKMVTGDPGRTADQAEGDRDTVEQSIRDKEQKGQI